MFINGIQSATTNNIQTPTNSYIGNRFALSGYELTGFLSNLHVVKGTALYTSNFTPPSAPITSVENTKLLCCNFGQKPFKFPPPAGFQPLALANTPRPSIVRPDQYVGMLRLIQVMVEHRVLMLGLNQIWCGLRRSNYYMDQLRLLTPFVA
jgi:hypothetical protein